MIGIFYVLVLFVNISNINGWDWYHLMFFYAISITSKAIADIFLSGAWALPNKIRKGELDILLIRPLPVLIQLVPIITSSQGLGNFFGGLLLMCISSVKIISTISIGYCLMLIVILLSGSIIHAAVNFVGACISFWTKGLLSNTFTMFIRSFCEFNKFPLDIYPAPLQLVLTYIIPFGFVGYYPGMVLLDKASFYTVFLTPMVAIIISIVTFVVWKLGLSKYDGVGS